jgi:hypothetical protein
LLKLGSRHLDVWRTIVDHGNPANGITSAQLKQLTHLYHPQVLADLKQARLVTSIGMRKGHKLYIADPRGRGEMTQRLDIKIEVYETEDGAFLTRTVLKGRVNNSGKIKRLITERHVTVTIPVSERGIDVVGDISVDPVQTIATPPADTGPCIIDAPYEILPPTK